MHCDGGESVMLKCNNDIDENAHTLFVLHEISLSIVVM